VAGLAPADSVVRAGVRVITAPLAAQRNARVLQRNLADLTQDAYTIVAGRVTSVRSEAHPQFANIHTVVVTLSVSEVWKGHAYGDFSFRMFVDDPLDQQTDLGYKPGQEVLLFLTKPSQYGLSSPAGLEQGRFLITKDAQGNRFARNGVNNFGLFAKIDQKAPTLKSRLTPQARQVASDQTKGPITYDQLKEIVLALLAGSR
jgi:hypothetical protein